ncbi:unnamed protein product [Cunninghamella echinulata]
MKAYFPNDLNEVLASPTLLNPFETYLSSINAHENLLFVEAISQLKYKQDTRMIEEAVHRIWKTFIEVGSPLEINISDRNEIINQLKSSKYKILSVNDALEIFHKAEIEIRGVLKYILNEFIKTSILPCIPYNIPKVNQKRVVIVGGGFVGFTVASILDPMSYFHVTLIDTKDSFEYTPGMVKMLVRPEETSSLRVRHDAYVKNGRIIIGRAEKIVNDGTGILVNNETIGFDYLVIGTGSTYQCKLKSFDISSIYRMSALKSEYIQLKAAKNVLIIGGGLVGCELASEIASHKFKNEVYEKKTVTLIESHTSLIYRSPSHRQRKAYDYLKGLGVNIILNEKIVDFNSDEQNSYLGASGQYYNGYDKVYIATGTTPNSQLLKNNSHTQEEGVDYYCDGNECCGFGMCLDYYDRIRVKPTLQLDHGKYQHIFAGGDVTNTKEEKTGYAAVLAGTCISRNICRMEKGKKPLCQGDKGTLAAPLLPLHGIESNGGIGRQNLSSFKKTFSFLHPSWSKLKQFDEKEFLQLVASEISHSKKAIGQLPKKLTLKDSSSTTIENNNPHNQFIYEPPSPIHLSGKDVLSYTAAVEDAPAPCHSKQGLDIYSISSESTLTTLHLHHSQHSSAQTIYNNAIYPYQSGAANYKKECHTELS